MQKTWQTGHIYLRSQEPHKDIKIVLADVAVSPDQLDHSIALDDAASRAHEALKNGELGSCELQTLAPAHSLAFFSVEKEIGETHLGGVFASGRAGACADAREENFK